MFHRITVELKGGILRVGASIAERLLLKRGRGGCAPGCGRACPALGGLPVSVQVVGSCWRDCLVVTVGPPVVALGVGVSICLRFRRGRALRVLFFPKLGFLLSYKSDQNP